MKGLSFEKCLENYAELLVSSGVNVQSGEGLLVSVNVCGLELARLVAAKAYKAGAKHVEIFFNDDEITLARYMNGCDNVFENYPSWKVDALSAMYEDGYSHLFITSPNPLLLKEINPEKISKDMNTINSAVASALKYRMTGKTRWCLAAVPSPEWAKLAFPGLDANEAVESLWKYVFAAVRADTTDGVKAWKEHDDRLKKYVNMLNASDFEFLEFRSDTFGNEGTNLKVYLADGHNWMGGSKNSADGIAYIANMPTEEVFTTPHRLKTSGKVVSSKPLSLNGNIVDGMEFSFENGKVVDFKAKTGFEVLKKHLESDEGAAMLGEVALVPVNSPIAESKILFNNTLFDENASVHLALGRAYPYAMNGGSEASADELLDRGANYSIIHTDFMIGTNDMSVIGVKKDKTKVELFANGKWV